MRNTLTLTLLLIFTAIALNAQTLYVDAAAGNDAYSGTAWNASFQTLSQALKVAGNDNSIQTILVASGTYYPTGQQSGRKDSSFVILRGGLKLYGGYPSGGGTRNIVTNPTFLDGNINDSGSKEDNSFHVMVIVGVGDAADSLVVDGFTIRNGYGYKDSNYSLEKYYKGGLFLRNYNGAGLGMVFNSGNDKITIRNCTFSDNEAERDGGGMYCVSSSPIITQCTFSKNKADNGGGMYYSDSGYLHAMITHCTFSGNSAVGAGGGMYNERFSSSIITNCTFSGNLALFGAGIRYYSSIYATIESIVNCTFSNNKATYEGGGIAVSGAIPFILINCTFSGNTAGEFGSGALDVSSDLGGVEVTLNNSIIWGNSYPQIKLHGEYASVKLSNSIVQGGGFENVIVVDPLFANAADPDGPDNIFGTADDGLRLLPCSAAIDAGDNAAIPANITRDITGASRIQLASVDIGAYEASSSTVPILATSYATVILSQSANDTISYKADCLNLIATVASGDTPDAINGTTVAKVWVETIQNPQFVKRHYQITPSNNASVATGSVTLYFTQAEFDDFNAVNSLQLPTGSGDATGIANLLIEKRPGSSSNGTGLPGSYTGPYVNIDPVDTDIVWNAGVSRWEVSFAVTGFSGFFVKTQQVPLPVTLIAFTGTANENNVRLAWSTSSEANSANFELQRSADATRFNTLAVINSHVNSSSRQDYNYDDLLPLPGINYYRLKMNDEDGTYAYSRIIRVEMGKTKSQSIYLFPNPVSHILNLSPDDDENVSYEIIDGNGKVMREKTIGKTSRSRTLTIDIKNLSEGLYFLMVEGTRSRETLKFVKE